MVMNLYRAIDRGKVQFDFIIFTKDHDDYYDEITEKGGKVFHFHKINATNLFSIQKEWSDFFKAHPEYRVLHSHVRSFASVYIPIAKKYHITTIIHSHSTSHGPGLLKDIIKTIFEYPLRFQADYLFSCSTEAGKWLYGENVLHRQNYRFIPNAIPISNFIFSTAERERIRKRYGILDDEVVIGHVGAFKTPKNHPFLIKCFRSFLAIHAKARLILVGSGDHEENIKDMCKEYDISDHVVFAGLQVDVGPYLSAMDLFLFPSIWEGLPVSVVEAQASGLKCILSDSITKDVHLSDLVKYLPLSLGENKWAEEIKNSLPPQRRAASDSVLKQLASFDSEKTAQMLELFYLNCAEKQEK